MYKICVIRNEAKPIIKRKENSLSNNKQTSPKKENNNPAATNAFEEEFPDFANKVNSRTGINNGFTTKCINSISAIIPIKSIIVIRIKIWKP